MMDSLNCSYMMLLLLFILIYHRFINASDTPFYSSSHHYDIINNYPHQPQTSLTECDQVFISSALNITIGSKNGTFVGPSFVIPMPPTTAAPTNVTSSSLSDESTAPNKYTRQCIYTFIAGPNERVQVSFTKFSLRAESPECLDEYLDIYAELKSPDGDLLSTPFGGRYCDLVIPHDRISLFQTIVISFYTAKLYDGDHINGSDIFEGTYEFINATPYVSGTPMPNEICSYTIYSEVRREGEFMTPTYPGVYPKNITCYYLFKGVKGQRVKLEFLDFDLYYGGPHCPYDYVKIYDGENTRAPLINTYCGQQRQLFVFSSGVNLLVQFTTLKRISAVNQNRGFSGYFEFSEKFVNLGFIMNNENSEHIRGTECDQKIFSRKESNGTIYAPNYPFLYHSNIMCKYFLYGLQDAQNLERINFHFEMLQIPTKDVNECTDAYVRLYTQLQAMDEFDYVFCGETIPPPVVSDGPLLLVVFNSGSTQGQGFKAHYWFETDFKIMGTQASPGQCHFSYVSSGGKSGEFNSPRHPSNYPSNTYCTYEFFGEPDEQVNLVFNHFKFSDADQATSGLAGYNEMCTHDWVEVFSVDTAGHEQYYGRYCGLTSPGPIMTENGVSQIKVIMNTDDSDVSSGFSANYQFDRASNKIQDCGGNFTNLENGVIQTPNYPNNYPDTMQVCNWFITVRTGARVLLYFDQFSVEGDPPNRGCSGAIVRIWTNLNEKPMELCGERLNDQQKQFISEFNVLRITFLTAQKAVGAQGFSAIWTEIDMPSEASEVRKNITYGPCATPTTVITFPQNNNNNELQASTVSGTVGGAVVGNVRSSSPYQCRLKGYCISSKLHCNGIQNCGFDDDSDESDCIHEVKINLVELVGGMTGLLMFIFFAIGVICLTIILIINWYRRSSDEKNVGHIIDKTCQHYFSHSTPDYSAYYQSDAMNVGTPHRLIDVMTVSSSSTTPGGQAMKNVRWPSASNSADSSHHPAMASEPEQIFLDSEGASSSPIPPPPPPPMNRSLLTLRQSSLVNFHYGDTTFKNDPNVANSSHTHSMIGIDRNFNANRQFAGPVMAANSTRTMSRQTDSRTSTFTAYPYCTLNNVNKSTIQTQHCQQGQIGGCLNNNHQTNTVNRSLRQKSPTTNNHHQTRADNIEQMDSVDSSQLLGQTIDVDDMDEMDDNSCLSVANNQSNKQQQQQSAINNGHHSQSSTHDQTTNNNNSMNSNHSNNHNNNYLIMMDHDDRLINNHTNGEDCSDISAIIDQPSSTAEHHPQQTSSAQQQQQSLRKYQMTRLNQTDKTTINACSNIIPTAANYLNAIDSNIAAHSSLMVDE